MVTRHFLSPALLSLWGPLTLSWWISCFCLFTILWFGVFWASTSAIEFAATPALRWVLTPSLISFSSHVLFIAVFSRLTSARRGPAKLTVCNPCDLCHWSTLLSCSPVISPSITPCTGQLECCGHCPQGLSISGGNLHLKWGQSGRHCWPWPSEAHSNPLFSSPLSISW